MKEGVLTNAYLYRIVRICVLTLLHTFLGGWERLHGELIRKPTTHLCSTYVPKY